MDLATMEMDPAEAEAKFEEYRAAVKERHDSEDEQIMKGYKVLARGDRLLSLRATLRAGGTELVEYQQWNGQLAANEKHQARMPRLAICRADADRTWSNGVDRDGGVTFYMDRWPNHAATRRRTVVPDGTFEETGRGWYSMSALVPPVPPALRPRGSLVNYHTLFEAEWKPVAPSDPALLRHIGGDLYAMVAVWNLTELERAVLAGRFTE